MPEPLRPILPAPTASSPARQRGLTLVELLVGLLIGLIVIGVATGALMASRGISGTVSDASTLQQQAAYAMRVIGLQMRQAGSLYLEEQDDKVVFLKRQGEIIDLDEDNPGQIVTVGFSADEDNIAKDCLGGPASPSANDAITSAFAFDSATNTLRCTGSSGTAQPLISNVADFQVRYLVQSDGASGDTKIAYVTAPANTEQIQGIEVCLVLYGTERIDLPTGSTYAGCALNAAGQPEAIDMTTLSGARASRMHLSFRNVFQLRGQGVL